MYEKRLKKARAGGNIENSNKPDARKGGKEDKEMELKARKDVPVEETWDLSLIFENEQKMWDTLEETKAAVKNVVETYAGKLNTAENIVGCLDAMEQILAESK